MWEKKDDEEVREVSFPLSTKITSSKQYWRGNLGDKIKLPLASTNIICQFLYLRNFWPSSYQLPSWKSYQLPRPEAHLKMNVLKLCKYTDIQILAIIINKNSKLSPEMILFKWIYQIGSEHVTWRIWYKYARFSPWTFVPLLPGSRVMVSTDRVRIFIHLYEYIHQGAVW